VSPLSDRADDDRDAQSVLTVDLDALGANWRSLAARAAPAECGAAVKADAYGIGIAAAVPALARAGCLTFFVAHASEGRRARAALDEAGLGARIFVLNGFHPESAGFDLYRAHGLDAVLGSAEELRAWSEARTAAEGGRLPDAALHVDTGMNRLGFPVEDARFLSQAELQGAGITLVMSHLVSAEAPADPINARQIAAFDHARERNLKAFRASLANSSGIFLPGRPMYDLVRPGYALYGGNPTPGHPNPMRPVVSLQARVLQLRQVPAGATAGYNARWTAERPSRLATIALGYADGVPITGSGIAGRGAEVFVGGVPCPLVGRISMDLSIADVTHLPAGALKAGDMVEWLGPQLDIDGLAARCGTIGYEILVNLGRRHQRHYIGNGTGTDWPQA
jgi:alanine racemase